MSAGTTRILNKADRLLTIAAGLIAWVGALGIVALMVITVVAVFFRYVINDPIFGIEDLSIIALTAIAGASVAYGGRHGSHVSVDVIGSAFSDKSKRIADTIMRILALGILGLATWSLFAKACGVEKACITSNFSIEHRPFYYLLGICLGIYTLQMLVELVAGIISTPSTESDEDKN